ncbi:hypothetical protein M3Y99_00582700 [Aphelenchoides fujianensis]|nr:hypothetical protein M3Y99_00582700 [Aphelenchoides fujianensis]
MAAMLTRSLVLLVALPLACFAADLRWSYDGNDGPSHWNGSCGTGHRQSPVDIRSVDVDYAMLQKVHFVNYVKVGPVKLQNTGHTVMISGFADWGEGQPFIFGGTLEGKYRLVQIHFHWSTENSKGSEHTLGGLHYPVEAHFVHQKEGTENATKLPPDGLAVVGVFLTIARDSTPLAGVEAALKHVRDPKTDVKVDHYTPQTLLPNNRDNFYTYDGSLTTPNCDETVVWTVLAEPASITNEQLSLLRALKSEDGRVHELNFRPTQPLNGRRIKYRSASMDRSDFCHSLRSFGNAIRPTFVGGVLMGVASAFSLNSVILPFFFC